MHRNHDPDLISALVEGGLTDPAEALELVEACPECGELFHAHLTVRQAIDNAAPAEMTDLERHRLRAAVWNQLEADSQPVSSSPTPWWYRIVPVAAALVVVVGVGSFIVGGGNNGGSATETTSPIELAAAPEADADEEARDGMALEPPATAATEDTTAAGTNEEEAFAADTTAAAADQAAGGASAEMGERTASFTERYLAGETTIADDFTCWQAVEDESAVLAAEADEVEGTPVWFVALGQGDEVTSVVVYDRIDCTVVFRDE